MSIWEDREKEKSSEDYQKDAETKLKEIFPDRT